MLYTFHCSLDNSFIVQRAHTMISEMVIDIQGLQMISIISIYIYAAALMWDYLFLLLTQPLCFIHLH